MAAELTGRSALISSASGIGAATARALAEAGAEITLVDRNEVATAALTREIGGAEAIVGDLREEATCEAAVKLALDRRGRLDILVNLAGLSGRRQGDGPVHEATSGGFDYVIGNNLRSAFLLSKAALTPMLEAKSGAIINVASVLAYAPASDHFATHAYAASKGALISLTTSMAAYYARSGIRVNCVSPGLIATPMSRRAQDAPEIMEYLERRQPLSGGPGQPEDVASAILYLASDAARLITGANLEVSGGWSVSS